MADTTTAPDTPVRRKTRATQRGRQLEPGALADIEALLAGRPRTRDSLIEHLHAIQDAWGHLALRHLRALAHWMNLPMAAVFETATFYAHFDIVRDGEIPPPAVTIRVPSGLKAIDRTRLVCPASVPRYGVSRAWCSATRASSVTVPLGIFTVW